MCLSGEFIHNVEDSCNAAKDYLHHHTEVSVVLAGASARQTQRGFVFQSSVDLWEMKEGLR